MLILLITSCGQQKNLNTVQSTLFIFKPQNSNTKLLYTEDDTKSSRDAQNRFSGSLLNSNRKHHNPHTHKFAGVKQPK